MSRFEENLELDEEAPFLPDQDSELPPALNPTRTPLPIFQFSILLTAWLSEAIISQSIGPYLNQVQYALFPACQC